MDYASGQCWCAVGKGALQVEVNKKVKCKANKQAQEGDKVTLYYGLYWSTLARLSFELKLR